MTVNCKSIYVVIPAYNEESRITAVLERLQKLGFRNIVVVDDGSTDNTWDVIPEDDGIYKLQHIVNLGPGASTMTGIEFALGRDARYIATIDADHQNDPDDLVQLFADITEKQVDLIIGSRFLKYNHIPFRRIIYNQIGNLVSFWKSGLLLSDSQSGLKVMTRKFAEKLYIEYNGFEFCIDIIKKAKLAGMDIAESPVSVTYTKETLAKGQSFENGLMMLGKLFNPFTKV
ncbi:MAG: glycosyltransferase family 2 protein [Saprospiraceae bacterium]|nr:glycosyltransferase family 2 protein [Saprospiraceae bacterium]